MGNYSKIAANWWRTVLQNTSNINKEALDLFEENLSKVIETTVEESGVMTLEVGLKPDYTLSNVANESGISTGAFPWKASMGISVVGTTPQIVVKLGASEKKTL